MSSSADKTQVGDKYWLPFEFSNTTAKEFMQNALSTNIVGFSVPRGQSLGQTWGFCVHTDKEVAYHFSALPTSVGDWQEMGRLRIRCCANELTGARVKPTVYEYFEIPLFKSKSVDALVYEDESVLAESGIVFTAPDKSELKIVCAPAPGAVSVAYPALRSNFLPELALTDYNVVPLC